MKPTKRGKTSETGKLSGGHVRKDPNFVEMLLPFPFIFVL